MDKIRIDKITEISKDKLYYRNIDDKIAFIELGVCANNYDDTHDKKQQDKTVRCIGERRFGEYAYYELYTADHTQIYMELQTNGLKRFISRITGWNFYVKDFQLFYSVQKQLNVNGWTTIDLS
ncbi:MAG: hypothetical protein IJT66_00025 [Clostridia bacterium]|nr:hypothetical protein [Clostridia bacterium]